MEAKEISIGRIDKNVETKAGDFVASQAAGEWGMGRHTGGRLAATHDVKTVGELRNLESRGWQDGHDTEDWLRAEQRLLRHYA